MRKWLRWLIVLLAMVVVSVGILMGTVSAADTIKSPHYQFNETDLGSGGLSPASSANYQTALSIGDIIGNTNSNSFQFEAGSQTTSDPALSFAIINSQPSFGIFSPTTTASTTSQFAVSDYTSYGYVVQIIGSPPTNGSYQIAPMSTNAVSQPGASQFGINLVNNSNFCGTNCNLGADPNHGQFGVGSAATGYNTANSFRYVSGDTIAIAPKSSGVTTYTISYIVNVTSLTPGGQYTSNQSLVCTATF